MVRLAVQVDTFATRNTLLVPFTTKQAQRLSPDGREKLAACIRGMLEVEAGERRRLAENLTAGTLWREIGGALSPVQAEQVLDLLLQIVEDEMEGCDGRKAHHR